jgi:alpha-glucosidase
MQWDATQNAGFSTADETWLPVAPDYAAVNVAAQEGDPDSLLSFYRRTLALRRITPALNSGRYYPLDAPDGVFAYRRQFNDQQVIVALNFTSTPQTVTLDGIDGKLIVLSTDVQRDGQRLDGETITLSADEGLVIAAD